MRIAAATVLTIASTAAFVVLERLRPGRGLRKATGWYARALLINFCQIVLTPAGRSSPVGSTLRHVQGCNHFVPACGFPRQNEKWLGRMLLFEASTTLLDGVVVKGG